MEIKYKAEVIGSMLRPEYLKRARKQWTSGEIGTREFKKIATGSDTRSESPNKRADTAHRS